MTCTPGTDFNDNTARVMIDEWNDLALDESLFYAAGHAPLLEESLGGEGKVYWQLFWDSKEAADAACRHRVSGSISLLCSRCFSPFPHGTGSLSVSG